MCPFMSVAECSSRHLYPFRPFRIFCPHYASYPHNLYVLWAESGASTTEGVGRAAHKDMVVMKGFAATTDALVGAQAYVQGLLLCHEGAVIAADMLAHAAARDTPTHATVEAV